MGTEESAERWIVLFHRCPFFESVNHRTADGFNVSLDKLIRDPFLIPAEVSKLSIRSLARQGNICASKTTAAITFVNCSFSSISISPDSGNYSYKGGRPIYLGGGGWVSASFHLNS